MESVELGLRLGIGRERHDERTRDLAAAKTFLTAAFAWAFTDYGPDYASFNDGQLNGGVRTDPDAPLTTNVRTIFFAENLEASLAHLQTLGAAITAAPYEFPGGRRFEFTAPGGLFLAVWSDRRADGSKIA